MRSQTGTEKTYAADRPAQARRSPVAYGVPPAGLLAQQSSAGNAAVIQMMRAAGRLPAQGRHQNGDGCGHEQPEQADQADQAPVQRSAVHGVLRGAGRPMDRSTRADMEARLGADFSDVRIHNDAAAKASAAEIGARAYTSGSHVVIGEGGGDRHTLAHELTHVIQQRRGPVAGTDNGGGLRVSDPSDRFEREADANARAALSGPAPQLQRAPSGETSGAGRPGTAQRAGEGAVQRMMPAPAAATPALVSPTLTAVEIPASIPMVGDPSPANMRQHAALRAGDVPEVLVQVDGLTPPGPVSLVATDSMTGDVLGQSAPQNIALDNWVFTVPLAGAPGLGAVGQSVQFVEWILHAGNTSVPLPGIHPISLYRLLGAPTTANPRYEAVEAATRFAHGQTGAQDAATALRGAISATIPYNGAQVLTADPLTLLASAPNGAVCSDFANLHILLAQALGIQANAVMFWGGFMYGGRSVWASDPAMSNNTLTRVQAINPANNPPGNPQGWDFTYHAIANIGGTLHDAALNREGYDAQAIHDGLAVFLPQLLPQTTFAATAQSAFSASLAPTLDMEAVHVALRQHGDQITAADFAANMLVSLPIPPGTQGVYQDPVRLSYGNLPAGITLQDDGTLSGTPTATGFYVFTVTNAMGDLVTHGLSVN
ncbi:DUF4157 domain-containing protein [Streptomyces sp. NPDC017546]|uniref:eCIS core domain-containing protein n=1 Tax=Streptomyces sp. NPDC017546 TaxID=3365001 RepID=UPI0037A23E7C